METVKEQVKNIFQTNTFENALEATRELRNAYLEEHGVKSWNAMVAYYKKANIQPAPMMVAEPTEEDYQEALEEMFKGAEQEIEEEVLPFDEARELESESEIEEEVHEEEPIEEEPKEKVEYMVYRNSGNKLDFYGHQVNYKSLPVGSEDMMIRMFNLGIGKGKVVATASLTIDEVGVFHSIYANIRKRKISEEKMVEQFAFCLNHLHEFLKQNKLVLTDGKISVEGSKGDSVDISKMVNKLLIFGM